MREPALQRGSFPGTAAASEGMGRRALGTVSGGEVGEGGGGEKQLTLVSF